MLLVERRTVVIVFFVLQVSKKPAYGFAGIGFNWAIQSRNSTTARSSGIAVPICGIPPRARVESRVSRTDRSGEPGATMRASAIPKRSCNGLSPMTRIAGVFVAMLSSI